MAKAGDDSTWISHDDAVGLFRELYRSKAEEILRTRGLVTGKVPWSCAELTGPRRPSDPGIGDRGFWRRESKYVLQESRPHENWARRRVLQAVPHQRHSVLCDYQAFGIKLGREAVMGLLPAAAKARLAEKTVRVAVQEVAAGTLTATQANQTVAATDALAELAAPDSPIKRSRRKGAYRGAQTIRAKAVLKRMFPSGEYPDEAELPTADLLDQFEAEYAKKEGKAKSRYGMPSRSVVLRVVGRKE